MLDRKKIVTPLIVIIIIVVIAAGGFFLINLNKNSQKAKTTNPIIESYRKQLSDLAKKSESSPTDPSAHKNYAVALYATGDLAKAKDQYQSAIKYDDKNAVLYNNLGNVNRDLGRYDDAINAYGKAIGLNPKGLNSYVNLGNMYDFSLGKPDLAVELYKNALKANPKNVDLEIQLGISYEQTKDFTSAESVYSDILKDNPGNQAATAGLSRVKNSSKASPSATPTPTKASKK